MAVQTTTADDAPQGSDEQSHVGAREKILRAALRVIGEDGVQAVSNRRLAKEAGVALGSLTYHFPSQTELLRESLLLYMNHEIERLNAVSEAIKAGSPTLEEVLQQVVQVAVENVNGPEQLAVHELHLQAGRDPELRDASKRCFEAYDGLAIAALEALGMPSTPAHARVVVALISGASLRAIGTAETDEQALGLGLAILARGVSAD